MSTLNHHLYTVQAAMRMQSPQSFCQLIDQDAISMTPFAPMSAKETQRAKLFSTALFDTTLHSLFAFADPSLLA